MLDDSPRKVGRPRKADTVETAAPEQAVAASARTHVTMKRNPEHYPGPHTANVHLDEVNNWAKHGWERAD